MRRPGPASTTPGAGTSSLSCVGGCLAGVGDKPDAVPLVAVDALKMRDGTAVHRRSAGGVAERQEANRRPGAPRGGTAA
jgi:hypothetical protein